MQQKTQPLKIKHYSLMLENNFFHAKFSAHLKFNIVSIDHQHTLWNIPEDKNGREYMQFSDKRL